MDYVYDSTSSGNLKRVQKLRDERDEERQENGRLRAKVAKLERGKRSLERTISTVFDATFRAAHSKDCQHESLSRRNVEVNPASSG